MSVLFTGSTGVKFVKALNKQPLKLSLSYQVERFYYNKAYNQQVFNNVRYLVIPRYIF